MFYDAGGFKGDCIEGQVVSNISGIPGLQLLCNRTGSNGGTKQREANGLVYFKRTLSILFPVTAACLVCFPRNVSEFSLNDFCSIH